MDKVLSPNVFYFAPFFIVVISLLAPQPAFSEVVGAHVTKIPYFENNQASTSFEVCAGNAGLENPQVKVSSNLETKTIEIPRFIEAGSCIGDVVKISATDLSSIKAELVREKSGTIFVDDAGNILDKRTIQGMSNDGQIRVEVTTGYPAAGQEMTIQLRFLDVLGNPVKHVNYDLRLLQEKDVVLEEKLAHTHSGKNIHHTAILNSDKPVDIEIVLQGLGLPSEQVKWQGPTGKIIFFHAVPEFGPIVLIIFMGSMFGIILASYKFKIGLR